MPFGGIRRWGESLFPKEGIAYYDVNIQPEDIESLKGDWLTDNIISFWEEYLEREFLPRYPQARIVLLRPSMSVMLLLSTDPTSLLSCLPCFDRVSHVFLPINDTGLASSDSGSHWSLLLVSIPDRVAFHYDSIRGHNFKPAVRTMENFGAMLGLYGSDAFRFVNLDDSPQQANSNDCGVFVCLIMRHLLVKRLLRTSENEKISMSMGGKQVDALGGRREMLKLLDEFRKESLRRQSEPTKPKKAKRQIPRIDW